MDAIVDKHRNLFVLLACAFAIALFSIFYLSPQPLGDSQSYVEAMGVFAGLPAPEGFVPNRILTTSGGLVLVLALSPLFGILNSWLVINVAFYLALAAAPYFLLKELFASERVAFLGALFVATNYAPIVFGLGYLMDVGGWACYVLALWGVARFVLRGSERAIVLASIAVGVGTLFKEYAVLGCIAIATALVRYFFRAPSRSVALMAATAALSLGPVALVHLMVYQTFGYSYLDWMLFNAEMYRYDSRVTEYVKALGSLLHILSPLALLGAWFFARELARTARSEIASPRNIAILAIALSALPAFFWGGITQRVLFVLVPAVVLFACFLFARYERQWYYFLPILAAYFILNLHLDLLLARIDLPI